MWGNVYTTRNDVGSDIAREPSGRDLSGFHYAKPKRRTLIRGTEQLVKSKYSMHGLHVIRVKLICFSVFLRVGCVSIDFVFQNVQLEAVEGATWPLPLRLGIECESSFYSIPKPVEVIVCNTLSASASPSSAASTGTRSARL